MFLPILWCQIHFPEYQWGWTYFYMFIGYLWFSHSCLLAIFHLCVVVCLDLEKFLKHSNTNFLLIISVVAICLQSLAYLTLSDVFGCIKIFNFQINYKLLIFFLLWFVHFEYCLKSSSPRIWRYLPIFYFKILEIYVYRSLPHLEAFSVLYSVKKEFYFTLTFG